MSLPQKAEGEFALVREHIEWSFSKSGGPVKWGSMPTDMDLYIILADMSAQERDEAGLQHYAPLAEESSARFDHKLYLGIAHRAWGVAHTLAGEYVEAQERLNKALKLFRSLKTRWQMGRTLYEMGELAVARGDTTAARRDFSRALAAFEEMQAAPDAARTSARLESVG